MHRAVLKLLFPFTNLFWEKTLSSAKQEAVRKYPTLQDKDFSYSLALTSGHTASLPSQSLLLAWCAGAAHRVLSAAAAGCGTASARAGRAHRVTERPLGEGRRGEAKCLNNLHHQLLCNLRFWLWRDGQKLHVTVCRG